MKENINGEHSYQEVLQKIKDKITSIKTCDTVMGNEILSEAYGRLNESMTPILELKAFSNRAEELAGDDVTLMDVVKFIRNQVKTGDINFLINICKEEHFKKLIEMYHPAPEKTIESFKVLFDGDSETIENGIKNGIFDSLKSDLLQILKNERMTEEDKKKNALQSADKQLLKYNPVGVIYVDDKNNKAVHLMQNFVIEFEPDTQIAKALPISEIEKLDILPEYKRLMNAIHSLPYNPVDESFTLNEKWDFECKLKDNVCLINGHEISKEDLPKLLLESINTYTAFPDKVGKINRDNYLRDADNMILLLENCDLLIKYDNLECIKNLNENSFVMFDKNHSINGATPYIVASSDEKLTGKLFESYHEMAEATSEILKDNSHKIFESQILHEKEMRAKMYQRKIELREEIKTLNENIQKMEDVRKIAEEGSASSLEAGRRLLKLNESLNSKMDEMAQLEKIYK